MSLFPFLGGVRGAALSRGLLTDQPALLAEKLGPWYSQTHEPGFCAVSQALADPGEVNWGPLLPPTACLVQRPLLNPSMVWGVHLGNASTHTRAHVCTHTAL